MRPYAQAISEAIDHTDAATLALVEDVMRDGRSGLDGLTPAQFRWEAREAWVVVQAMHDAGELGPFCAAVQLDLPEWAA